jgi:hypothetical protein
VAHRLGGGQWDKEAHRMAIHGGGTGAKGHAGARSNGWLPTPTDGSGSFAAFRRSSVRCRTDWRTAGEELSMRGHHGIGIFGPFTRCSGLRSGKRGARGAFGDGLIGGVALLRKEQSSARRARAKERRAVQRER